MKSIHSIFSKILFWVFMPIMIVMLSFMFSCNQKPSIEINSAAMNRTDTAKSKFTAAMVDNKKDPNCGMPVTAGIEDTVHYNGKVYGFCSDECKQAFLKNPVALAKNADLK
jgi:YHS domain-containing protein